MTREEIIHVYEHSCLVCENFTPEAVTAAYVEALSALRAQQEQEKNEPPTNADRIRAMSDEELAELLSQTAYAREIPWSEPFYAIFCDSCPAPEYTVEDGRKLNLHECDFSDGKCPHGGDILWWLQQPAEGGGAE